MANPPKSKYQLFFSILNYLMLAVFLFGAIVQYNDPDFLIWGLIYASAAFACYLAGKEWELYFFYLVIAIWGLGWALLIYSNLDSSIIQFVKSLNFVSMSMNSQSEEIVREIGGLLIISFWMIVLTIKSYLKY